MTGVDECRSAEGRERRGIPVARGKREADGAGLHGGAARDGINSKRRRSPKS